MTKSFVEAEFTLPVQNAFIATTSKYVRESTEQIYFQTLSQYTLMKHKILVKDFVNIEIFTSKSSNLYLI